MAAVGLRVGWQSETRAISYAVDDEASVLNGETIDVDVLGNDSDPGGDLVESSLTITSAPSIGTAVVAETDGE